MKKLIPFLLGGILVIGAAGCEPPSRTSTNAPDNANENVNAPAQETAR